MSPSRVLFALPLFVVACSSASSDADAPPSNDMQITTSCAQTKCDERKSRDAAACRACSDACSAALMYYSCDVGSACSSSCSSRPCEDVEVKACATTKFDVALPKNASPDLARACRKMLSAASACGVKDLPTEDDCDHFALVERPERAAAYECTAALPCDGDAEKCAPEKTDFGTTLCQELDDVCGAGGAVCAKGADDILNREGAWLRPDVMAAAHACAHQGGCTNTKNCFVSWVKAVVP